MQKQPILCIDLKKKRIRIHKHTLHMLGDPEYIQLLVNPSAGIIAVKRSFSGDYLAHRIRQEQFLDGSCYELYSTGLVRSLQKNNSNWNSGCSYRIYGNFNSRECMACFSMKDTIQVGDN